MKTNTLIGPIMADVAGLELSAEDRKVLRHPLVGGVILFTRNYRDRTQLKALCDELRALKKPRLLIAVDHEGGRVQRFREGFTRVPPMRDLGRLFEQDPAAARRRARELGATIGQELAVFGIDLCFAPVLDIDNGLSQVIGDRAFAGDAEMISTLARAFSAGLADAGMAATGKHFPGHGAVVADSHKELPVDPRAFAEIEATELAPFQALIADNIPSLMMAHVRYTDVDQTPASLSKTWITSYLRGMLGYRGAVFCDDLSMGGAAAVGSMKERALRALAAGCDMLPVCNDRPGLLQLLKDLRGLKLSPTKSARLKKLYLQSIPAMTASAREAEQVFRTADCLHDAAAVQCAYDRLAASIASEYAGRNPLFLCVMIGGLVPTAEIIRRLDFAFELDYLHASRYRGATSGGGLVWKRQPDQAIAGREVVVIDDILDEGHTLVAIRKALLEFRPASLKVAVLAEKLHDRRAAGAHAEFIGLAVEDRYVFGCGMDYKNYYRQLPGIWAVKS